MIALFVLPHGTESVLDKNSYFYLIKWPFQPKRRVFSEETALRATKTAVGKLHMQTTKRQEKN